jgi:hypothetical protein
MTHNKDGQVILLEEGESLVHDPRMPAENIGHPVHDWRSKAFELFRLSERRRAIIRTILRKRAKAKAAGDDWRGF